MNKYLLSITLVLISAWLLISVPEHSSAQDLAHDASLASLTITPEPSKWEPGPVPTGDNRKYGASYSYNPNQISVTPVAEDPGAVITVNGIPVASGGTLNFPLGKCDTWLYLEINITESDGDAGQYIILLTNDVSAPPFISVVPFLGDIVGFRFNPSSGATMTIRSAPGGTILAQATESSPEEDHLEWREPDDTYFWRLSAWGIPIYLSPGMEVTVTDGECTVSHVVLPCSIDEVDTQNDIVRGTGAPGAGFSLMVWAEGQNHLQQTEPIYNAGNPVRLPRIHPQYDPRFIVDSFGHWEINLGAEGIDITDESYFDIGSSTQSVPVLNNPDFDVLYNPTNKDRGTTGDMWPKPVPDRPHFAILLNVDYICAEGLGYNTEVNLTVRSAPGGDILFTDTQTASYFGDALWGIEPYPTMGITLEPGMEVTLTRGKTVLTGIIADMSIDSVNQDTERVSGTGSPGDTLQLFVGNFDMEELDFQIAAVQTDIVIGSDGTWQVDFSGRADITTGMLAIVTLQDSGDLTSGAAAFATVTPEVQEENISVAETSDTQEVTLDTVSSDGSKAHVAVPAGTLPSGAKVKAAAISNKDDLVQQIAPPDNTDLVMGFTVEANDADGNPVQEGFLNQVILEFNIDAGMLPPDTPPEELKLAFWNGVRWTAVEGIDVVYNQDDSVTLTALVNHFTVFSMVVDPEGEIRIGKANPLDEFPAVSFGSMGINISPTASDEEQAGNNVSAMEIIIIVGICLVVLILAGGFYTLKKKQKV